MNLLKTAIIAMVLVLSAACAKENGSQLSDPDGVRPPKSTTPSLPGKTTHETLSLKYNKVVFQCDLWVQHGEELIRTNSPNDHISWNLLEDFAEERSFSLEAQISRHSFAATLNITSVDVIGSLKLTTADGTVYKMKYTPIIDMDLHLASETRYGPGQVEKTRGFRNNRVYEKITDPIFNSFNSLDSIPGSFFNYIECSIDTEIKDEYKNQFSVIER